MRILDYGGIPETSAAEASVALGAPSPDVVGLGGATATTLSLLGHLATDRERIAVADDDNPRVLIWDAVPTTNGVPDAMPSDRSLRIDPTSWMNVDVVGRHVFVSDSANPRLLIFEGM